MRADLGVMISASHNKYVDNGIKLFGPNGFKLSDEDETAIEALLEEPPILVQAEEIGRSRKIEDARGRYIHAAKLTFPPQLRLDGLKIVIDCANGAAYQVAPSALWELGANVSAIGVNPNGVNINEGCGSTDTALLRRTVLESGADIGLALDGDADRLIVIDEKGNVVDGDQLMALIGITWNKRGLLRGGGIVATIMSNLGLERFLETEGLKLERTKVGDRYVLETMRAKGYNVGGEQSGHIILTDYATTGDGLVAGLQILAALVESGRPASEMLNLFDPFPQLLKNIRYEGASPLQRAHVKKAIAEAEARLGKGGRLVIRKSGTEPLVRVMAQGDDEALVTELVDSICEAMKV
jgi:phosphoglucosamine mutase